MSCKSTKVARTRAPFRFESNVETWMTGHVRKVGMDFECNVDLFEEVQHFLLWNKQKGFSVVQQSMDIIAK